MTDEELNTIHEDTAKRVKVSCDEYHTHSARQGCLEGNGNDPRDVTILRLTETLFRERGLVREAAESLGR